jgi:hypothetical protein
MLSVAVATAEPLEKTTVGAVVYPAPGVVTAIADTRRVAVATAGVVGIPPPSVIVTSGAAA